MAAASADAAAYRGGMAGPDLLDGLLCGVRHPDHQSGDADTWVLVFDEYVPAEEGNREALCTLANGYWGTRGACRGTVADGAHYPGTYFAGVYDVVDWAVDGVTMPDEEIVNAPNWLPVRFCIGDDDWFGRDALDDAGLLDFHQELDVRHGILTRIFTVRDASGCRRRGRGSQRCGCRSCPWTGRAP